MTLGPAVKPLQCTKTDCIFPDVGICSRRDEFDDPLNNCPSLVRANAHPPIVPTIVPAVVPGIMPGIIPGIVPTIVPEKSLSRHATVNSDEVAPWRGRHLNLSEAEDIVRRSPARVISVLGPYDAGKTSLLASFFLQLANGHHGSFPYRIASSRTLYGFQDLVDRANKWSGQKDEQIVEHTPKDDGVSGGRFLHLGLRPANEHDDRHIDVLLSDVTGEWIDKWTKLANDESKRRLAFVPRSNGFIIVADAEKLMSEDGMDMDDSIGLLIRRVLSMAGPGQGRGFGLILSKFDKIIDHDGVEIPSDEKAQDKKNWGELGELTESIWGGLDAAQKAGFAVRVFAVSAFPKPLNAGQPAGVMAPFTHVMTCADRRDRWPRVERPVPEHADPFQAMRRWRAEP